MSGEARLACVLLGLAAGWVRLFSCPRPAGRLNRIGQARGRLASGAGKLAAALTGLAGLAVIARAGQLAAAVAATVAAITATVWLRGWRTSREKAVEQRAYAAFFGALGGYLEAGAVPARAVEKAAQSVEAKHRKYAVKLARMLVQEDTSASAPEARLWHVAGAYGLPTAALVEQIRERIERQQRHRETTKAALNGAQSTAFVLALLYRWLASRLDRGCLRTPWACYSVAGSAGCCWSPGSASFVPG